jgi:hypothetical protein
MQMMAAMFAFRSIVRNVRGGAFVVLAMWRHLDFYRTAQLQ